MERVQLAKKFLVIAWVLALLLMWYAAVIGFFSEESPAVESFEASLLGAAYSQYYTIEENSLGYSTRNIVPIPPSNPYIVEPTSPNSALENNNILQIGPEDWERAISFNSSGKVYVMEPGVYNNFTLGSSGQNGPYNNNVFIGLNGGDEGVVWDGRNSTKYAMRKLIYGDPEGSTANALQIINVTIKNYIPDKQWGEYEWGSAIYAGKNAVIVGNTFEDNYGALNLGRNNWFWADGAKVTDNVFRNNKWQAIYLNGNDYVFEYNELDANARPGDGGPPSSCNQGDKCFCWYGQTKFTNDIPNENGTSRPDHYVSLIQNNYAHDNNCSGLWLDVNVRNAIVRNNVVDDNLLNGIAVELSPNVQILNNVVRRNGPTRPSGWGNGIGSAQLAVWNSRNVHLYGNQIEVTGRAGGMGIIYETWRDSRSGTSNNNGQDVFFKGNTFVDNSNESIVGYWSDAGNLNYEFDCNTYILPNESKSIFRPWTSSFIDFSAFKSRGFEANGRMATSEATLSNLSSVCNQYLNPTPFDPNNPGVPYTSSAGSISLSSASSTSSSSTTSSQSSSTPPSNDPGEPFVTGGFNFSGIIQAEEFNVGSNGSAYSDFSSGNHFGTPSYPQANASSDVDIKDDPNQSNNHIIGYLEQGEWLRYSINVPETGEYRIRAKTHSTESNRSLQLYFNEEMKGDIPVPTVGNWDDESISDWIAINLDKGETVMRVLMSGGDFADVDYFEVEYLGEEQSVSCKGDFNADLKVGVADFSTFAANYLQNSIDCSLDMVGDDCYLNEADLEEFMKGYKKDGFCSN